MHWKTAENIININFKPAKLSHNKFIKTPQLPLKNSIRCLNRIKFHGIESFLHQRRKLSKNILKIFNSPPSTRYVSSLKHSILKLLTSLAVL